MIEINKFSKEIRTKLKERYDLSKYNDSLYFSERGKDKKKLDKRRISLVLKDTCPYIREDILEKELYDLIENELISKFEYKPFKKKEYYGVLKDFYVKDFKEIFVVNIGNNDLILKFNKSISLNLLKKFKGKKIPLKSKKFLNNKWAMLIDFEKLKEMFKEKNLNDEKKFIDVNGLILNYKKSKNIYGEYYKCLTQIFNDKFIIIIDKKSFEFLNLEKGSKILILRKLTDKGECWKFDEKGTINFYKRREELKKDLTKD